MSDPDDTRFRMRPNDEDDESLLQEEFSSDRIEKLGQRITLVSILLPLLLVAVTFLIYLDLNKRVALFQSSGTTEVKALAENVGLQVESLMRSQKELAEGQKALAETQSTLQKKTEQLRAELDKATADRAEVQKLLQGAESRLREEATRQIASKPDRKEFEKEMTGVKNAVAAVKERIQQLGDELKSARSEMEKEHVLMNGSISDINDLLTDITRVTEKMEARISTVEEALKTTLTQLPADTVRTEDLKQALQEEKEIYRQMLSLITRNLEGRMESLRQELEEIKHRSASSSSAPPPVPWAGKAAPATPTPTLPPLPDSSTILEQSID
ncbi:MAG: hypothetical protein LJE65_13955 [Desulfobacteraceae bacterium]|nr:hypothetical protein [Desulfobacteraceae bacterium]